MLPHFEYERASPLTPVCGVDEAGRGPWAGPVVAASVVFHNEAAIPAGINDSKALSKAKREALADAILQHAATGIGIASVEEIDALNILQASMLAMQRAIAALPTPAAFALIDGNKVPMLTIPARAIVQGDAISISIAAASIVAKVTRDRMMAELAQHYPHYGFEKHAGYGTKLHRDALATYGPCPAHRMSFAPLRKLQAAA
jgi:ribonuclease HII